MEKDIVNIGKSVVIKGELNGSEDLTIEGHVEGTIQLREHVLTIGPNGHIKAQVFAKSVIVLGEVTGNVTASDKVDIRDNGSVDGDIVSPRVAIAEGAHFRGSVDMQRKAGTGPQAVKPPQPQTSPAQPPQAQAAAGARTLAQRSRGKKKAKGCLFLFPSSFLRGPWACSIALHLAGIRNPPPWPPRPAQDPIFATKALRKFLSSLTSRESPVLLDLGPVVGSNVSFFGEQLGCKIFVEDIYADLERHIRAGELDDAAGVSRRNDFRRPTDPSTAFCAGISSTTWISAVGAGARDAADARAPARRRAARVLRHGAAARDALHEIHHCRRSEPEASLYRGARGRQAILLNRDIIRLFAGLRVSDSFLLQNNLREILFRKTI